MSGTKPFDPDAGFTVYTIEEVVELTGFSRHMVAVFCRQGFVEPVDGPHTSDATWTFDDDALRLLRHLALLHRQHGLDLDGLHVIGPLLAELEALRAEVRMLRRRG